MKFENLEEVYAGQLKALRRIILAVLAVATLTTTAAAVAVADLYQKLQDSCELLQDRAEAGRRLWTGIFDAAEEAGGDVEQIQVYREIAIDELPPVEC